MAENRHENIGNQLVYLGQLHKVCDYLSHQALRNVRLTCRTWYLAAERHVRFQSSICKFRATWLQEYAAHTFNPATYHRWTGAYFTNMSFLDTKHFQDYWLLHNESIRVLKFRGIKIKCDDMVRFLHRLPAIEDLYFYRCGFAQYEVPADVNRHAHAMMPTERKTMCLHNRLADLEERNVWNSHTPRIRSLKWKKQTSFPLCLLDYLILRCMGTLEKFCLKDMTKLNETRAQMLPNNENLVNRYRQIFLANAAVLRSIEVTNIRNGPDIILACNRAMRENNVRFTRLEEVSLGQALHIDTWQYQLSEAFINILDFCDHNTLLKIKFEFTTRFYTPDLIRRLRLFPNIRTFMYQSAFRHIEQHDFQEIVLGWNNLSSLEYSCTHSYQAQVQHLPVHAELRVRDRAQNLRFSFDENVLQDITMIRSLKRLHLDNASLMNDANATLIFTNMPQIEDLGIYLAAGVTDISLTGFTEEELRQLRAAANNVQRLRIGEAARQRVQRDGIPNLGRLTKLRKLTLYGCVQTDISLMFAIRFDQIRELDLTYCPNISDVGIPALGSNNPTLERVILIQNPRVTCSGINNLVGARPTLVDLHTTKLICSKTGGLDPFALHPKFNEIVSIAVKNEIRAPIIEEM